MDTLLTAQELAGRLNKSTKTLETWRRDGKGPAFIRVGREIRYRETDVARWLERNTVTTH